MASNDCIVLDGILSDRKKGEGKRTEPVLFRRMAAAFGMDMDVYAVGGNIYAIYRSLERERFKANVKDVAAELSGSAEDRKVLSQDFADTFVVFDCDPHHTDNRGEAPTPVGRIVERNFGRILEMARHLGTERRPTPIIGAGESYRFAPLRSCLDIDRQDSGSGLRQGSALR